MAFADVVPHDFTVDLPGHACTTVSKRAIPWALATAQEPVIPFWWSVHVG